MLSIHDVCTHGDMNEYLNINYHNSLQNSIVARGIVKGPENYNFSTIINEEQQERKVSKKKGYTVVLTRGADGHIMTTAVAAVAPEPLSLTSTIA